MWERLLFPRRSTSVRRSSAGNLPAVARAASPRSRPQSGTIHKLAAGAEDLCPIQQIASTPKSTSGSRSTAITATVGITDYAQESLGDIVFVETPKVGAEMTVGKTFGTVESVKAVSDLFAPATGTVTEVNADLATSPEKVNKDAHGSWMMKMTLKNPGEAGCASLSRRTTRSL